MGKANKESGCTKTAYVIPSQPNDMNHPTKKDLYDNQHASTIQQNAYVNQQYAPTMRQNANANQQYAPTMQQNVNANQQYAPTIQQTYPAVVVTEPYQTRPSQNDSCLICMAVVAIFFCPILGIIAVFQVVKSRKHYAAGNDAAAKSRKTAAIVLIVLSIIVGIGFSCLYYYTNKNKYEKITKYS